jgi:uncharacterized membrane protein YkoI
MKDTFRKTAVGASAAGALALAGATVAIGAGSSTKTGTTTTTTATPPTTQIHTPETPLTGDTLAKVKAAAVAKVGGTVDAATTENDSGNSAAVYEAHVTKADGTRVTVILDSSYNVLSVETGGHGHFGHGDPGDHGGPGSGETELTGATATAAKAAAVAKVGGTADRASTENDSSNSAAAYEVLVTKADGSHVKVILDKNDNVLSVETGPGAGGLGGPGGPGDGHFN